MPTGCQQQAKRESKLNFRNPQVFWKPHKLQRNSVKVDSSFDPIFKILFIPFYALLCCPSSMDVCHCFSSPLIYSWNDCTPLWALVGGPVKSETVSVLFSFFQFLSHFLLSSPFVQLTLLLFFFAPKDIICCKYVSVCQLFTTQFSPALLSSHCPLQLLTGASVCKALNSISKQSNVFCHEETSTHSFKHFTFCVSVQRK